MDNPQEYQTFKITFVGDSGVGKTNIISRFTKGCLPNNCHPTIGVEFATKTITLYENLNIKLQIWDMARLERYKQIIGVHLRNALGVVLVYDITSEETFENLSNWLQDVRNKVDENVVIMIIGNKIDIEKNNYQARKVPKDIAADFAKQNNLLYEEISAHTDKDIENIFNTLALGIFIKQQEIIKKQNSNVQENLINQNQTHQLQ